MSAPDQAAPRREDLSGLEYVRALMAGVFPASPMARNVGWQLVDVQHGAVRMEVTPGPHLYNHDTLHGGAMATMMDGAMAMAVNSSLPRGARALTIELNTRFVAAPRLDCGPLSLFGKVVDMGERRARTEGRIEDASGKVYCHASGEFHLKRPPA